MGSNNMKPQNTQQQMLLMLGLVFLVLGITMMGSSRGGGIAFLVAAIVMLMLSLTRGRR